jgi:hypothetical protein
MVSGMSYDKYRMHLPTVLRRASTDPVATIQEYMRQCFREHGYHARASIPCGYVTNALCAYIDDYDAANAALTANGVVIREEDHFLLSPQERLRLLETEGLIEHWMEHDYSAPSFYPTCPRDGVMAQLRAELAEIGGAS